MDIVLDKSYLEAAGTEIIRSLCEDHTVLFTETLFFELLTTTDAKRTSCLRKFPPRRNPVLLIPRVGPLFRYEIKNKRPASPVSEHRLEVDFTFNPETPGLGFVLVQDESQALAEWSAEIQHEVETFHHMATSISTWCPDIRQLSGHALQDACKSLKQQAARDPEVVRGIYGNLELQDFPAAALLDFSWALFRWVQSHVLFYLDHISRYGFADPDQVPKRIEHDFHDIQYALYGALSGALATRDEALASNFKLMCPDGTLIE